MPRTSTQRSPFFPKADAAVLQSKHTPPPPNSRPTTVGPILDVENANKAIDTWSTDMTRSVYPEKTDIWGPALIPERPQCVMDRYLFPVLTRNERLRLTLLFYYTRGALEDTELVSRLQDKVHLARETVGWEFVIAGLLDHNTYTRIVTVGLPLAVLPRRESTCAHTVNQPPGTIFTLPNMLKDWRFRQSPHVEQGGLRAYAGAPLRFETEYGEHVAFGSLCVASNTEQEPLSKSQQTALARLADWIVADIVHSARMRRQKERRRMLELLSDVQKRCDNHSNPDEVVVSMLREVYPSTTVDIRALHDSRFTLGGGREIHVSELEHGLWEDSDYFDFFIENENHLDPVCPEIIRVIAAECADPRTPTYLTVGSKDLRLVFDDADSWFVQMSAAILSRAWQNRALKEALTAKETFVRGITHQLRTPIHGILGSVELLAEELKARNLSSGAVGTLSPMVTPRIEDTDPYVYIRTIQTSARELIATVNSLIKLNRWADITQAKRVPALHYGCDIEAALLSEINEVMPNDLPARPSIIYLNLLPIDCELAIVDLPLLLDCIQPLLVNAIQNTAGGVVAVTVSITEDYQALFVDIEDTGCGIRSTDQERIFNLYEKINETTTGAGLGLTLASRLATLLNGSIALVSSEIGKGSHFRATLREASLACSLKRPQSIKQKLSQLPATFYLVCSSNDASHLCNYFCKYLVGQGFTQSQDRQRSFLVLDYTLGLTKLYERISQVAEEVGICLLPETDGVFNFKCGQVQRENNVVYVKGPFSTSILEGALTLAHSILTETALYKVDLDTLSSGGVPLEPSTPALNGCITPERLPGHPHRNSFFSTTAQASLLDKTIPTLRIATPPLPPPCTTPCRSKPKTLLVDDNVINLRLLEMYCSRRTIPYCTAVDGQQAVELFAEHQRSSCYASSASPQSLGPEPIGLVLMDLQMPVCDGIDATCRIRALEREHGWDRSVVFIVTGQDSPSDRESAKEAGADAFLVKPVAPKVLDRGIGQWFPDVELG